VAVTQASSARNPQKTAYVSFSAEINAHTTESLIAAMTHNVGNVDSIGNAIFLAGEKRYACEHSTFMFHGVAAVFQPAAAQIQLDAKQLRERLDGLDADELRIGSIIEQRTKLDHAEVVALFREQRTKDAANAVSAGIVHEIKDVQIPPGSPIVALVFQR